jgi:hypothetical protein
MIFQWPCPWNPSIQSSRTKISRFSTNPSQPNLHNDRYEIVYLLRKTSKYRIIKTLWRYWRTTTTGLVMSWVGRKETAYAIIKPKRIYLLWGQTNPTSLKIVRKRVKTVQWPKSEKWRKLSTFRLKVRPKSRKNRSLSSSKTKLTMKM